MKSLNDRLIESNQRLITATNRSKQILDTLTVFENVYMKRGKEFCEQKTMFLIEQIEQLSERYFWCLKQQQNNKTAS